jgi:hypothetical protein
MLKERGTKANNVDVSLSVTPLPSLYPPSLICEGPEIMLFSP